MDDCQRFGCYDAEAIGLRSHGPECYHLCGKPAHSTCKCGKGTSPTISHLSERRAGR